MKSDYIWMDGEIVPYDQATVHIITPTIHYGMGVFEGIRCYETPAGPAVFRLRDHLVRFFESIHILGISDLPYSIDQLSEAVHKIIKINGFQECYIRPLMWLEGPLGLNMDNSKPKVAIAAWEWGPYLGEEARQTGVHLMVSSFARLHPNVNMTKSKVGGNYVNSMLVKTLALRSGYDEAVILDTNGFVAECTGENIFMVRRGVIYTPPLAAILEGITRDTIFTLASDLDLSINESMISRDQLYIADEVFISGTAAEIVGVNMIDFRRVGSGGVGQISCALSDKYHETVHGNGRRSREWLDYVN